MNVNARSQHVHTTASTIAQSETEDEVSPFFIDLSTLNEDSLDHLRSVGLLPPAKLLDDDDDEASQRSNDHFDPLAIRLLRSAHTAYLVNALSEPLSRGFESLDASHPWMVYWCLHSLDLLGYFDDDDDDESCSGSTSGLMSDVLADVEVLQKGQLLSRIVSTLDACWTEVAVDILRDEVVGDAKLRLLHHQQQGSTTDNTAFKVPHQESSYTTIRAGGFGGGPQQMPHCAPTYAAVLSSSIVASLGLSKSTTTHPYHKAGREALNLLSDKRLQLYAFFVSLRVDASQLYGNNIVDSTAFRMQHDGEVDVRAAYCLLAPAYLLGLLDDDNFHQHDSNDDTNTGNNSSKKYNLLTTSSVSQHIASCQTFEGGFGAEPHNEAHGGYTFCALAALRILNAVHTTDVEALRGWLARRQLGYEGGFCGRTNKLVDGCYSFWQGAAVAVLDGWLLEQQNFDGHSMEMVDTDRQSNEIMFDELLLQRYILLCAQDVKGGLRDKPSKQRDFYHSCYNLSGLSVAQHKLCNTWPCRDVVDASKRDDGLNEMFGDAEFNVVGRTDPVINIRVERVQFMLSQQFNNSGSD